jgi:hypothetical protein
MAELLRTASELGLDPDAVAAGGLAALQALIALKRAKDAGEGVGRERLIAQVQEVANRLDPTVHADLLQQIQSRVLALQGRNGDTEVAHVTPGEIVLPEALQTPAVLRALREATSASHIPLEQLRVGSPLNSINPRTSQPEFFSLSSKESSSGQRYCELPDGRMVPYTDVGFGYGAVADGGTTTNAGAGVGWPCCCGNELAKRIEGRRIGSRGQKWESYILRFTDTQGCDRLRKVRAAQTHHWNGKCWRLPGQSTSCDWIGNDADGLLADKG